MKRILFIILTLGSLAAGAQSQYIGAPNTTVINRGKFRVDSGFLAPVLDTTFTPTRVGQLTFRPQDTAFYASVSLTGQKWRKIGSGGSADVAGFFNNAGVINDTTLILVTASNDTTFVDFVGGMGDVTQAQLDDTAAAIRADMGTGSGTITQSQLDDSTAAVRADFPTTVTTDATVINGSTNPVQGNAVYDELQLKVNKSDTAQVALLFKDVNVINDTSMVFTRVNSSTKTVNFRGTAGSGTSTYTPTITTSSTSASIVTTYETWVFTGSTGTFTLPLISGSTAARFTVKNRGTGSLTVARAGSNQIFNASLVNSVVLLTGDALTFQNDGTYWITY